MNKIRIICKICEIEFEEYKSSNRKYCSQECYWKSISPESHRGLYTKKCLNCGMLFLTKNKSAKYCSKNCSAKCTLNGFPNSHSVTKELKEKIRKANIGKHNSPETEFKKGNIPPSLDPNFQYSQKALEKMSKSWFKKGKEHPYWRGGITEFDRGGNWAEIRKEVYKRDNWNCQICNRHGGRLIAHHIIPYRISQNNNLDNLITLCNKCHSTLEDNLNGR